MLSIFLTEHHDHSNETSLYYFCQAVDNSCDNGCSVLQGLISQLCEKHPSLDRHARSRFGELGDQSTWPFEALWSIFQAMVEDERLSHVRCVIDGLDECEEDRSRLVKCFIDMTNNPRRRSSLSVLLVGREILKHGLVSQLSELPCISLDDDSEARHHIERDLTRFVEHKVDSLINARREPELYSYALKVLNEKHEGTFLWVGYVCEDLLNEPASMTIETLKSLPQGLEDLYLRILSQIPSKQHSMAAQAVQWVAITVRPLSLSELAGILNIEDRPAERLKAETRLESFMDLWGHILRVTKSSTERSGKSLMSQERIVRFPHLSVRDFLFDQHREEYAAFQLNEGRIHGMVAERLLNELGKSPSEHRSLYEYATMYWHEHVRASSETDNHIFNKSRAFFQPDSTAREEWWQAYCSRPGLLGWDYGRTPGISVFLMTCHLGLVTLVKSQLAQQKSLDETMPTDPSYRSGLMWAIQQPKSRALPDFTNDQVVQLLVDAGANVNFCDAKGRTPLHLVIRNAGRIPNVVQMMQLLVTAGASMSAKDELGRTPLHTAVRFGCVEAVRFLLDHRGQEVDINALRNNLETPLHESVVANNLTCIKMLLEGGADGNVMDARGRTPLAEASAKDDARIVELLLRNGARANLVTRGHTTPLHEAALRGCPETVRLLLDSGADLQAEDDVGRTPIYYAERDSRQEILRILEAAEQYSSSSSSSPVTEYSTGKGATSTSPSSEVRTHMDRIHLSV